MKKPKIYLILTLLFCLLGYFIFKISVNPFEFLYFIDNQYFSNDIFEIPKSISAIKSITIDPENKMADINKEDNIFPKKQ